MPVSIPDSSVLPRPNQTKPAIPPVQVPGRVGTPLRSAGTATPTSAAQGGFPHPVDQEKRGKKRERDDVGTVPESINGVGAVNGGANTNPPKPILSAKAGMAGIRPRPMKKLRMVSEPYITCLPTLSPLYLIINFPSSPGHSRTVTGCDCSAAAYSPRRMNLPQPRQPLACQRRRAASFSYSFEFIEPISPLPSPSIWEATPYSKDYL